MDITPLGAELLMSMLARHNEPSQAKWASAYEMRRRMKGTRFAGEDEATIKRTLKALAADLYLDSAKDVVTVPGKPGPAATGYSWIDSGKLITYRSTARLVIFLYEKRGSRMAEAAFIEEVQGQNIISDETQKPLTAKEIGPQIEFCIRKNCFARFENEAPSGSVVYLKCTDLVHPVSEYLYRLAQIQRRGAATEKPGASLSEQTG
jgi:hypothetical protein